MNNCFIQTVAILEDPISQQISTYKNTITLLFVALCCTWSWKNWNWKELKWNAMKFQCNFFRLELNMCNYLLHFWILFVFWREFWLEWSVEESRLQGLEELVLIINQKSVRNLLTNSLKSLRSLTSHYRKSLKLLKSSSSVQK